jgi:NAD(P)H dehydrogenase (quinone)
MIVVTGATGALNGATVDHLLTRMPAGELVVAVRDPARAQRFADQGVGVRRAGYDDPEAMGKAFAGADQLLLVSSNDPGADTVSLHRDAIDAAVAAGVGRILYTSHQGAALASPFVPARIHAQTEQLLEASGLPWTALRNGFYTHSLAWLAGPWRETGRIEVPADGPVTWTAREDAAEAAAVIIASDGAHEGPTTLTAKAAPTFSEVAEIASELVGRPVERVLVDPEAWVAAQVAAGQPGRMTRFILGMYQAADQGFFAGVDPLLGTLLGREPLGVREVLASLG